MSNAPDWVPFVPLLGGVLALVCLLFALRSGKRFLLVKNLPTSKTTGVFIGLVELKGTAESAEPLTSYLAECACVHYSWSVEEHWSRTVTETYTDSEGRTQTRTRTESGWTTVADGGEMIPFYLQDDCGYVLVRPEGAKVEPKTVFSQTCTPLNSLYYGKGPAGAVMNSTFTRRFSESAVPLHAMLYVMGQSRERADIVAPEIAADKEAPMFLISTRSEEQVAGGLRGGFWGLNVLALALTVAGFIVRDHFFGRALDQLWPWYVLAGFGYLAAACLGWVWMVFNSLIDLRQRVRQGWAQVDVQLKRRHDLIPNLVGVVTGLRDYERNLQTQVAELRAQQAATPPGVAGPDFHKLAPTLLAVTERYPELKSQESFAQLQQELINTESRIALARGYFNEIATHYNTRLEVVPDRFIAALGGLQPQALMMAEAFERAPVEVEFADGEESPQKNAEDAKS
ncbi:MAG: LemA family protein [Verrucomicrobia bacterium]|nr:LemA family protein [Verrucomicrobiota bacterium]